MIHKVCFFGPKKMRFMQTESVLQTKNRSGLAKYRFSVALVSSRSVLVTLQTVFVPIVTKSQRHADNIVKKQPI